MLDYKEQAESFKASARFYLNNKKLYERKLTENNPDDQQYISYLRDDLVFVEKTLEKFKNKCGSGARLIIYLLFVEGRTQQDVAHEYNMTRRQLQYSLSKWLKAVFEEEE